MSMHSYIHFYKYCNFLSGMIVILWLFFGQSAVWNELLKLPITCSQNVRDIFHNHPMLMWNHWTKGRWPVPSHPPRSSVWRWAWWQKHMRNTRTRTSNVRDALREREMEIMTRRFSTTVSRAIQVSTVQKTASEWLIMVLGEAQDIPSSGVIFRWSHNRAITTGAAGCVLVAGCSSLFFSPSLTLFPPSHWNNR